MITANVVVLAFLERIIETCQEGPGGSGCTIWVTLCYFQATIQKTTMQTRLCCRKTIMSNRSLRGLLCVGLHSFWLPQGRFKLYLLFVIFLGDYSE